MAKPFLAIALLLLFAGCGGSSAPKQNTTAQLNKSLDTLSQTLQTANFQPSPTAQADLRAELKKSHPNRKRLTALTAQAGADLEQAKEIYARAATAMPAGLVKNNISTQSHTYAEAADALGAATKAALAGNRKTAKAELKQFDQLTGQRNAEMSQLLSNPEVQAYFKKQIAKKKQQQ